VPARLVEPDEQATERVTAESERRGIPPGREKVTSSPPRRKAAVTQRRDR
jgi:hypothetical protein